jgi:hypothetical protein
MVLLALFMDCKQSILSLSDTANHLPGQTKKC